MSNSEALVELEREVACAPRDGSAWARLGRAYGEAGQHDLAFEALRLATRYEPDSPDHWSGLAVACLHRDDPGGALEASGRAADLAPQDPYVLTFHAQQLYRCCREHEAIPIAQEAARLAPPDWAFAKGLLGLARSDVGDHAGAVGALESSLRLYADQPSLWLALGISLAELRRFDEAANALETAVFLNPEAGSGWGRLGQTYTETARHREAVRCFERAVELGFTPWGVWVDMGRSAAEVGDLRALGRAYERLRKERPDDAEALRGKLLALQRPRRTRRRRPGRPRAGKAPSGQRGQPRPLRRPPEAGVADHRDASGSGPRPAPRPTSSETPRGLRGHGPRARAPSPRGHPSSTAEGPAEGGGRGRPTAARTPALPRGAPCRGSAGRRR